MARHRERSLCAECLQHAGDPARGRATNPREQTTPQGSQAAPAGKPPSRAHNQLVPGHSSHLVGGAVVGRVRAELVQPELREKALALERWVAALGARERHLQRQRGDDGSRQRGG
eukprot:7085193-Prymnesium_polylepis.1